MEGVLVTGMGIVTSLGLDVQSNLEGLRAGNSGIGQAQFFESIYTQTLPFAEVPISSDALSEMLEKFQGHTRTCLLAEKAFREAILQAKLTARDLSSVDTAFVSASTVGGMCITDQLYADANLQSQGSSFLDSYSGSAHALRIIEAYKMSGYSNTLNTACSSSANAIMMGMRLIQSGRAKRAIVGGVDSLAKYTVNGFNALKILSSQPTRPFDLDRDGLNLGEGAAYLVLEAESEVEHKPIYGRVAGYGNANDAYHPSAMSDQAVGAQATMLGALRMAHIHPDQIDYINTHGTGTINNDAVELFAMQQVFHKLPYFSSTKSFTGHTLGASGAIEAIYCFLSLQHQEIYPNLHVRNPLPGSENALVTTLLHQPEMNWMLSNSFGFGGNCTSLLLGKA
ncbi:beta-ketoacyl-[acyl-carrier-protein] synthase family protein [Dyadobacter tibetensis]|uniref:beta-ketoacyl-[acyl-carrier-protein] synthase family protein n=1 Tax=Dyadobacter tibetensis TaxID=1211851 RepID=UPI000470A4C1|nr:beta-ketoacyl-[acyl-carrier-protein] synthase family protein [Dyadobacter tibetensis]